MIKKIFIVLFLFSGGAFSQSYEEIQNERRVNQELINHPEEFKEKQKKIYNEEKSILDTEEFYQKKQKEQQLEEEKKKQAAIAAAIAKKNAVLKGVPSIGTIGHCNNSWWVNSQSSLHRLVEVCRALFLKNSPAAIALGVPGFRLRTCTTELWFKQHKKLLNLWCIMYHPNCARPPYEREAWQTCKDGNYSRLNGW